MYKQPNRDNLPKLKTCAGLELFKPDADTENMSYIQSIFYPPYEDEISFSYKKLFVGWKSEGFFKEGYDKHYNEVYLDLRESSIILILGKRGSGKTTLKRALTDRFVAGKGHVVDCSDIKNETQSSLEPNNDTPTQFEQYTRKGEHRAGLKMKVYQPVFLIEQGNEPDKNCERIQFEFSDFDVNDWLTLFKLSDSNAEDRKKVEVITAIYQQIEEGNIANIDDFKNALYQQEISKTMVESMIMVLDNVVAYGVIGTDHNADIEWDINNGHVVTQNLQGYENKLMSYAQIYVSILTKKIINAKRSKVIEGKMLMEYDEAPKFYPRNQRISSRITIDWGIDVTRSYGVSFMLAAQDLHDLPDKAFDQAKYVFVPYNVKFDIFKNILKSLGMLGRYDDATLERYRRMKNLAKLYKDGTRDWLLIDVDKEKVCRFVPCRPMSLHLTE